MTTRRTGRPLMGRPVSRRQLLALGGSLAAVAAAGCTGQLPESDVEAAGFGEGASGTVRFWCRAATLPASELMVSRFHEAQSDIRVELVAVPDGQYTTKLATSIRGRVPPDLVDIDDINGQIFIARDAFTDLTPLVAELPYFDQLSPGHLNLAARRDGEYHGVPYLGDLSVLFYNRALFEQAGLDPDAPPANFDELLAAAEAVRGLGGDTYGLSFGGNNPGILGFTVQPHVWATGERLWEGEVGEQYATIEGNEPLRRTLELYRQLWADELVPFGNRTQDGATWGQDFFTAGTVGMFPGSYGQAVLNANEEVTPQLGVTLLCGPEGDGSTFCGGDNLCIPRGAANASGAWQFVRFLLETEQQYQLPTTGYTPVRMDALTEEFRREYPLDVVALENLDKGYAPRSLAYNTTINQVSGPWFEMFQNAVFGGDVDAAMAEGQEGFTRSIDLAQA